MRKMLWLMPVILLGITGCHTSNRQQTTQSSAHSTHQESTKTSSKAKATTPLTPATIDDLSGHYFVAVTDHDTVMHVYGTTSGYVLEYLTKSNGADYTTSNTGLFNAQVKTTTTTYTFTGTGQTHALATTVTFKKLSKTKIQRESDQVTFKRVSHDDLSTIK